MNLAKKIIAILFCICIVLPANAQNNKSENYSKALVSIQKIISTGKRHNSYIFVFRVKKIISGALNDSILISQEIYHGFGGRQVKSKVNSGDVVIKFKTDSTIRRFDYLSKMEGLNGNTVWLKWVAEVSRAKSMERLEKKLGKYSRKEQVNFLAEEGGKLWFLKRKIPKIAVEITPGRWITATIDEEPDENADW